MKKIFLAILLTCSVLASLFLTTGATVQQIYQVWINSSGVDQPTTNTPVLIQFGLTVGTNTATYWGGYAGSGGESFLSWRDPLLGEGAVNELFFGAGATGGSGPNSQVDLKPATNALSVNMIWNDVNNNDSGLRLTASSSGVYFGIRTNSHGILNFDTTTPGSDLTNLVGGFGAAGKITASNIISTATGFLGNTSQTTNNVTTQSANYNIQSGDSLVLLSAAHTATLPTAVGIPGKVFTVLCTGNGTNAILTTSSQTIDGATKWTNTAQYKFTSLISDNANWWVIGQN